MPLLTQQGLNDYALVLQQSPQQRVLYAGLSLRSTQAAISGCIWTSQ